MENQLQKLKDDSLTAIDHANSLAELRDCEVAWLGKKGHLTEILKNLKSIDPKDRPRMGKIINDIKNALTEKIQAKQRSLETASVETASVEWLDVTLVPAWQATHWGQVGTDFTGTLHPLSKLQHEIETICIAMGFLIMDGPHVETETNNFDALNIPITHPTRTEQDTFYINQDTVLRVHTSPVQVRAVLEHNLQPPFKLI